MKYLKLFESTKKNWEVIIDPTHRWGWDGIKSYLHDKQVVDLTPRDQKQIIQFLEPYVPMSMVEMPEKTEDRLDYNQFKGKYRGSIRISTDKSVSESEKYKIERYSDIEIFKLDDDYFIVHCSFIYKNGIKPMAFKCDQIEGLFELLGMMFEKIEKKNYSDQNYITHIKRMINSIDIDKTDPQKLKSLEDFITKWKMS